MSVYTYEPLRHNYAESQARFEELYETAGKDGNILLEFRCTHAPDVATGMRILGHWFIYSRTSQKFNELLCGPVSEYQYHTNANGLVALYPVYLIYARDYETFIMITKLVYNTSFEVTPTSFQGLKDDAEVYDIGAHLVKPWKPCDNEKDPA